MNNKSEYRIWAKNVRQSVDLKDISNQIVEKIKKLDIYRSAKTVMLYLPKDIEVDLTGLFEDKTKSWFLPTIKCHSEPKAKNLITSEDSSSLTLLRMTPILVVPYVPGKTKLIKNKFNILEPEIISGNFFDQEEKSIKLDLIFVPGLCFDKEANRLGFGAGFYDRFLLLNSNSYKIGSCPKECLLDKLPVDPWDIKVDMVLTDS